MLSIGIILCSCSSGNNEISTQQPPETVVVYETVYVTKENPKKLSNQEQDDKKIYLLDEMTPYKKGRNYEEKEIISMGGEEYSHGFMCQGEGENPFDENGTYFNLDEKYSELRFVFGIVEESSDKNAEVAIYTDGELAEHFSAKMGDLPTAHSISVYGCKQLVFTVYRNNSPWYTANCGFTEISVVPK